MLTASSRSTTRSCRRTEPCRERFACRSRCRQWHSRRGVRLVCRDMPRAIICASGVSDSRCTDESAFRRERALLGELTDRARAGTQSLLFSGAPVYGRASGLRVEAEDATPETPYGRHQLECEGLIAGSGPGRLVLRLPNIEGAGRSSTTTPFPSLVRQTLNGLRQPDPTLVISSMWTTWWSSWRRSCDAVRTATS